MHPPVRYITWLIEKNLVPGAIVIVHDGISNQPAAFRLFRTFLPWVA